MIVIAARRLQVWDQGSLRAGGNRHYRQHVQTGKKDPCYVSEKPYTVRDEVSKVRRW